MRSCSRSARWERSTGCSGYEQGLCRLPIHSGQEGMGCRDTLQQAVGRFSCHAWAMSTPVLPILRTLQVRCKRMWVQQKVSLQGFSEAPSWKRTVCFFRAILSSPARQLRAARACYEATHMCSIRISTPDEQVRTPGLERTSISAMSLVNASTTERKSTPKTSCNPGALFRVL